MLLAESIAIGLVIGLVFYELTGLVAGGLVVPGYLALYWDQPVVMAATVLIALATLLLVRLVASVSILYGRRRFAVMVIAGFACQWLFESLLSGTSVANARIDVIGYIIPGLMANEMDRQGVVRTLLSLIAVSAAVRLCLVAFGQLRSW